MAPAAGLASAAALYGILLLTLVIPAQIMKPEDLLGSFAVIVLVDAVLVCGWAAAHWRDVAGPLRTLGDPLYWGVAILAVPATLAIAWANLWVATEFLGGTDVDVIGTYARGEGSVVLTLAVFALQPAIIEELAFRGVIFERLCAVVDAKTAIIICAALFTIMHLAFLSVVFLMCLGLLAGWLRWRSGSLYPAMALHLLHNTAVVILTVGGWW